MATHPKDLPLPQTGEIGDRIRRLEKMAGLLAKDVAERMRERFPDLTIDESKVSRWKSGTGLAPGVVWMHAVFYGEILRIPRNQVLLFLFGEAELSFGLRLVGDEPASDEPTDTLEGGSAIPGRNNHLFLVPELKSTAA